MMRFSVIYMRICEETAGSFSYSEYSVMPNSVMAGFDYIQLFCSNDVFQKKRKMLTWTKKCKEYIVVYDILLTAVHSPLVEIDCPGFEVVMELKIGKSISTRGEWSKRI